jgi:hypothetical protein
LCVDRLFGGLQHDAVRLEIENDILEIFLVSSEFSRAFP